MAELVDALDSGSSWGNPVKVQVFLAAASLLHLEKPVIEGLPKRLYKVEVRTTVSARLRYAAQEILSLSEAQ